ncbi:transcriptional regulator [Levilactobacillus senmaizukei DSM 21775 = NBRC 103853]|uniref:Transcriptional regulator n=1 Tax=Levilactobacillus senmaizukei DSM 21775 = NBRC 103853 TaxID=1423803 RepID=A0A0R2DR25_9LACO|nr:TetR/AcrR family transcriptional regulator [Levilactobacillus senmaizukei]KRN03287.1 transcriptional regulator [Levilactobacillus senmaizukei DSM 21775 = NBRC 103853]
MVKKRTLTREKVIDQAIQMIAERGVDQLTIRALADELAVRPQSIYNYIESLNDLLDQVGVRFVGDLADRLMHNLMGVSGKEALMIFAREFRQGCLTQRHLAPLLMNPNDLRPLVQTHAALVQLYQQMFHSLHLSEADGTTLVEASLYRSALFGFIVQEIGGFMRVTPQKVNERFDQTMRLAISQFSSLA